MVASARRFAKLDKRSQDEDLWENQAATNERGVDGWLQLLPTILRGVGAAALLWAIGSFLFHRWEAGSDIMRYGMLLGLTTSLTVIGFASGQWLRESKSARLFVSIALAAVPVCAAVLGAFMYQHWSLDGIETSYPGMVHWRIDSAAALMGWVGASAALLLPVVWLGFMVLARPMAGRLTGLFLFSCAALLMPVRDSVLVALLLGSVAPFLFWRLSALRREGFALATLEGGIATALLLLPLGIVFGRSVWLYAPDAWLILVAAAGMFAALRQLALQLEAGSAGQAVTEILSLPMAAIAGLATAAALDRLGFPAALLIPAAAMVSGGMAFELSIRAGSYRQAYRGIAVLTVGLCLLANLMLHGGLLAPLASLLAGGGMAAHGWRQRQSLPLLAGLGLCLAGVLSQAGYVLQHVDFLSWGALSVTGIVALLAAAMLERHGRRWYDQAKAFRRELDDWRI